MPRFTIVLFALLAGIPAQATEAGWALLGSGGQVVLLRTTNSPGGGEPAGFDIDDCASQRNLSERGRQNARQIGPLFLARSARIEIVLTSRYCRARDMADLAFGTTQSETFEALDLLSSDEQEAEEQLAATRERVAAHSGAGNLVMVTHGANIEALTGASVREGEAVIVSREDDELGVAARINFN